MGRQSALRLISQFVLLILTVCGPVISEVSLDGLSVKPNSTLPTEYEKQLRTLPLIQVKGVKNAISNLETSVYVKVDVKLKIRFT